MAGILCLISELKIDLYIMEKLRGQKRPRQNDQLPFQWRRHLELLLNGFRSNGVQFQSFQAPHEGTSRGVLAAANHSGIQPRS